MKITLLFLISFNLLASLNFDRITSHTNEQFSQFFPDRMNQITPSIDYGSEVEKSEYYSHKKTYFVEAPLEKAWQAYTQTHPAKVWSSKRIHFDFLFDKKNGAIIYKDSKAWPGLSKFQVIFFNITVLKIYTLAGAFEITELALHDDWAIIEFTYIEGNISKGRQQIILRAQKTGTVIEHLSFFKSGKRVRDKYLYPYFHEKAIDELHENVAKQLSK